MMAFTLRLELPGELKYINVLLNKYGGLPFVKPTHCPTSWKKYEGFLIKWMQMRKCLSAVKINGIIIYYNQLSMCDYFLTHFFEHADPISKSCPF